MIWFYDSLLDSIRNAVSVYDSTIQINAFFECALYFAILALKHAATTVQHLL